MNAEVKSEVQRENRSRLFRRSKPTIRPAKLFSESGYGEDMGILWAAYKMGSFPLLEDQDMSPDDFGKGMAAICATLNDAVIVEDDNRRYESGRGPVAFVGIRSDGWRHEPHVDYFAWATPRNIVRASVGFLQFMRYHKQVGVCIVRCLKPHVSLFRHVSRYVLLNYLGRIVNGTPRGDEYVFTVAGKKRVQGE